MAKKERAQHKDLKTQLRSKKKTPEVTDDVATSTVKAPIAEIGDLKAEAIAHILEGIAKPEKPDGTKAFIPKEWDTKYKPVLGSYKKFLLAHPDTFRVIEHD